MTGKTHKVISITFSLGYYLSAVRPEYGPATFASVIVVSYLGALLPDIDQPAGELWGKLPFGRDLSELANPFLKHRNITHSLFGVVISALIVTIILGRFPSYWGINQIQVLTAFLIGYLSHLLADMFTVEGIPLFFPYQHMFGIPPKPLEGIRITTGQWFENLVIFPLFNLLLIIIIWVNWANIKHILYH